RGSLAAAAGCEEESKIAAMELAVWVLSHRMSAGPGMQHHVATSTLYLPLSGGGNANGVLVVQPRHMRLILAEHRRLLETLASQIALALERARLSELASEARTAAERASLRNTLLASISHDLRGPLSAIAGAGSLVAQAPEPLD